MDIPIIHLHTLSKELKFCLTIDKKYNPLVFIYLQVIKDKFPVFDTNTCIIIHLFQNAICTSNIKKKLDASILITEIFFQQTTISLSHDYRQQSLTIVFLCQQVYKGIIILYV
jgi:hypothetical protein